MDIIEIFGIPFLKKGSGIHIKKENRGKFTDYCGGKVTNECIQRGKNSSDPKIRKRATFAQNSRSWSKKHQEGGWLELLPIYGTFKSAERFIDNPSWGGAAETGLSLLGDVGMFTGAGALIKGLSIANKATKATKAANLASRTANTVRKNYWDTYGKLSKRIKHNEGVINSLSVSPQKGSQQIITQRIKDNRKFQNLITSAREADKNAIENMKNAWSNASALNNQASSSIKSSLLPSIMTVPAQAASTAVHILNKE